MISWTSSMEKKNYQNPLHFSYKGTFFQCCPRVSSQTVLSLLNIVFADRPKNFSGDFNLDWFFFWSFFLRKLFEWESDERILPTSWFFNYDKILYFLLPCSIIRVLECHLLFFRIVLIYLWKIWWFCYHVIAHYVFQFEPEAPILTGKGLKPEK